MSEDEVTCHSPTPGKQPTRIDAWKFRCVRDAIVAVVQQRVRGVRFKDLTSLVAAHLFDEHRANLGSVIWYTVSVKLHMETLSELQRVTGSKPQRLLRRLT